MEISVALLLSVVCVHGISCGPVMPAFSEDLSIVYLSNSTITSPSPKINVTSSLFAKSSNITTTADQIIVPKAAIVNASEILQSVNANVTTKTNEPSSTLPPTTIASDNKTVAMEDEIVVPKKSIDNATLELAITTSPANLSANITAKNATIPVKMTTINGSLRNETQSTSGSATTSETVQPNQGLGPISVHKRDVDTSENSSELTSSYIFEKYDKWNGTGAATSQEVRDLRRQGVRFKRSDIDEASLEQGESGEDPSFENEFKTNLEKKLLKNSQESDSAETSKNLTATVSQNNDTNVSISESAVDNPVQEQQVLQEDEPKDDDSGICAVDKEDEEATRLVTIFWRTIFCVIFVIIIVYPIYSYTKIYCQKRRKDAESISNKRFVDSDSDISIANDSTSQTTK